MVSFNRTVSNMMARYGGSITVVVVGDTAYNPATSENVATETAYTARAAVFDFTLRANGLQTMKDTQIQAGDKNVMLEPLDATGNPLPRLRPERDFVEFGGRRYKIVTYKETNPDLSATPILIELQVRA